LSALKDPLPTGSWLAFDELDRHADAFDALVAQTPDVDHFCSSTDWILPAQAAFAPSAMPFVMAEPGACVALMRIPAEPRHEVAVPLEAGWGLASPFVGAEPAQLAEMLGTMVEHAPHPPDALFLSGIVRDSALHEHVVLRLAGRYRIGMGPPSGRRSTSIAGGLDGFLTRRSSRFRASLRRALRRAADGGLTFTYDADFDSADAVIERIMAVETRSWKGRTGQGVDRGLARRFYELMVARLVRRGGLRVVFARLDEADVAFCLGGLFGETYRGLQVSFAEGLERWSPGNLVQLEMIRGLAAEGVETYHLGMEMPYKARWAEPGLETITLALLPW
jgi:hypothetical protein